MITAGLRLFGFRRVRSALERWSSAAGSGAVSSACSAEETARLVEAASRLGPYPAPCLPRSLALWWLLRRQARAAELRIGVRLADDPPGLVIRSVRGHPSPRLQAHAWVECDGVPLSDPADTGQRFAALNGAGTSKR
jgi:hypothetical protein